MRMLSTTLAVALAAGLIAPTAASARMSRTVNCEDPANMQSNCIGTSYTPYRTRYVRVRVPPTPQPPTELPPAEVEKILMFRANGGGNPTGGGAGGGGGGGGGGR